MPTFDYSNSAGTASSLIAKFGQSLTFTRPGDSTYDPATGTTTETETTYSVNAVWLQYNNNEVDGTVVLSGDAKVIVSADATPAIDDRVTFGGTEWRVVNAMPLSPGGVNVMHTLQVRK